MVSNRYVTQAIKYLEVRSKERAQMGPFTRIKWGKVEEGVHKRKKKDSKESKKERHKKTNKTKKGETLENFKGLRSSTPPFDRTTFCLLNL